MARPKRTSATLQAAEKREAALQSISPDLDLGNNLTLAAYSELIETLRTQISTYNSNLSNLDDQTRRIRATEQQLRNLSEQMLLGVAAKYGKDSGEYGKAGGTPKSERQRSPRKQPAKSSSSSLPVVTVAPTSGKAPEPVNGNGNGKLTAAQA